VLLNATPLRDAVGKVFGVVGVGQDVTQVRRQAAEKAKLLAEKFTVADKYARALDNLTDVVFEVSASSWSVGDWRVGEHSASFCKLFPLHDAPLTDFVKEPGAMLQLLLDARDMALSKREMTVVKDDSSRMLTVEFQAVNISAPNGQPCVLIVCHDLTDFKFRIEVEKDRQVAAKLQHEDKNTHKAQEVGAHYAIEQLGIIEAQLIAQCNAAALFASPELKQIWMDLAAVREHSFAAVEQAKVTLRMLETRSQRAQEESHMRIMMYQLVADEYVAALTTVDVVARLMEEFRGASDVRLRAFHVPEVQCDWTLLWYGIENALSNARKCGVRQEPIEIALEYREPTLTVVVTNQAEPQRQAVLIASHGRDATALLHQRRESSGTHSTNFGGHAMRNVARLMRGSVSLTLLPSSTRLQLEVCTPRASEVTMSEALSVYFIDDEPTMRMVYSSWVRQPSPLHPDSKIFPPPNLSPAEADDAMKSFTSEVMTARPQPRVVVLDQNLRSQVQRRVNVITGTEIARTLRHRGYRGLIIIRSANISTRNLQEYLAAGADAAMSKDESRERMLSIVSECQSTALPRPTDKEEFDSTPLLADDVMLGTEADRDAIMEEFRQGASRTLEDLRSLLDDEDVGALPDELHYLLGQCRAVGARRMQQAISACKERFSYKELHKLEALLTQTMKMSNTRTDGRGECAAAHGLGEGNTQDRGRGKWANPSVKDNSGESGGGAKPITEFPLFVSARRIGPLLDEGCKACRKEIMALRCAIEDHEPIQLILHSLLSHSESMGAARLARLCAQLKEHGDAPFMRTASLLAEVDELDALLTETESACKEHDGGSTASSVSSRSVSPQTSPSQLQSSPLFVACIDDSELPRQLMKLHLLPAMQADLGRSLVVGQTRDEQLHFVDFALGRIDVQMRPLPLPHQPADVVVVDQNLLLDGKPHCYGTVLIEQLRIRGFTGVACIITADFKDAEQLSKLPGVDLVVPKNINFSSLALQLRQMATGKIAKPAQAWLCRHSSVTKSASQSAVDPGLTSASSSQPEPPLPLIDTSHFIGLPRSLMQKLFLKAYHPSVDGSLAKTLQQLQTTFEEGGDIGPDSHSSLGIARSAGANLMAHEIKEFRNAPSAAALKTLWNTLHATREQLKVDGFLPADAFINT